MSESQTTSPQRTIEMNRVDTAELILSLNSGLCPACGGQKERHHSLCSGCYFRVPNDKRHALYRRIGRGYEAAFAAAMSEMKAEQFHRANESRMA